MKTLGAIASLNSTYQREPELTGVRTAAPASQTPASQTPASQLPQSLTPNDSTPHPKIARILLTKGLAG